MSQFRQLVEKFIKEAHYPENFNIEEFSSIPTFKGRLQYCDKKLQRLGVGSSRIVYKINDERVLKIAKNTKGVAQNQKEADFGRNAYGITTNIYDIDYDNYSWIEMELAYPIKKGEVNNLIGISFEELIGVICYIHDEYAKSNDQLFKKYNYDSTMIKEIMEKQVYTEKNSFLYQLYTFLLDYQPSYIYDYCRIKNWGKVLRNGQWQMVITDDGFDENVAKLYHKSLQ